MHPKLPKFVEFLVHAIAVLLIVTLGIRKYELISYLKVDGFKKPSEIVQLADPSSKSVTIKGFKESEVNLIEEGDSSTFNAPSRVIITDNLASLDTLLPKGYFYQVYRTANSSSSTISIVKHSLVYGLYIIGWFIAYFFFFAYNKNELKKKLIAVSVGWLGLSLVHMGITVLAGWLLSSPSQEPQIASIFRFGTFSSVTDSLFAFYFLLVFLAFLSQTTVQFLYRFKELEEADHVQSELALIRSQLRPHFLFNTLNNLYSMSLESNNEALSGGIQNLTGLMRYSLKNSTKELVILSDEWDYILKYIELQKLRLEKDSVNLQTRAKGELHSCQIAPMILINFVENAFKHGISYEKPSFVDVQLEVSPYEIILSVKNSNHPSKQDTGTSGIGTEKTIKLLQLYYNNDFDLDVSSDQNTYSITLTLPIK